ncbi:helix-turn-helix domain-containing protein [Alkalihalobacterium elongatum]|uniref:helix-turn-helix domain-containing protein n=1 Tax=Alkalihalobacterium elongatum TaxID=2675466 RepID=UPI001C1F9040|nr:tetratricopeptide repeat protein [Alkalihalobacterium elongatum]
MEAIPVGKAIRDLRNYLRLSQKELAKGICTQSLISQIECGDVSPSADVLYKIANRFGVDINYFFDITDCPRLDYVKEVFFQIRQEIRKRNYEKVSQMIESEMPNPLFQTKVNQQFMLWHQAICIYYIQGDAKQSLELLKEAVELTDTTTKNFSERQIEILTSIAIIYSEVGDFENSFEYYQKALYQLKKLPVVQDKSIRIRILFNFAKTLSKNGNYQSSLEQVDQGIRLCIEHEIMCLFGELHFQKGKNLNSLGHKQEGLQYLEKAKTIFDLEGNEQFADIVKREINFYSNDE